MTGYPIESAEVSSLQDLGLALVRSASIEINVQDVKHLDASRSLLQSGTKLYVSHLPNQRWEDTVAACRAVHVAGFDPVPHIPVRLLDDETALDRLLAQLTERAHITEALLISGDYAQPRGAYASVLQVLRAGKLQAHGLRRVSLAGHPEGHPTVPREAIRRAEIDKAAHAREAGLETTFVTQFCFESTPFIEWSRELRREGVDARLVAGIAGPASIATLFKLALRCGVGPSIRALGARPGVIGKLIGDHSPEQLIGDLAHAPDSGAAQFSGLHVFCFGGYLRTCRWLGTAGDH